MSYDGMVDARRGERRLELVSSMLGLGLGLLLLASTVASSPKRRRGANPVPRKGA